MGNINCCKTNDTNPQSNMDLDKTKKTITKTEPPSNPHNQPSPANLLQSMQSPIIEPAINRESLESLPATVRAVVSHQNDIPKLWNDTSRDLEEVIFDISDDKSESIFTLLNQIRMKPDDYINEAKAYEVDNLLIKASKNSKPPSILFQNESYYFELREVLMCCYNETPKCEDDIHNDIKSINVFKKYNIDIYTKQVDLNKHNDSVWMLLQEPKAYDNILTKKIDYCIVCAMPLKDKNEMKVYFIMLENKMRDSLII